MKIRDKYGNPESVVGGIKYSPYVIEESEEPESFKIEDISTIRSMVHTPIKIDIADDIELGYVPIYDFSNKNQIRLRDVVSLNDNNSSWNVEDALEEYITELKNKEGLSLKAYKDGNGWSIGYGHYGVKPGDTITQDQAEQILRDDIKSHSKWLIDQVSKYDLTKNQFLALFDFGYNAGVGNLKKLMSFADKNTIKQRLATWGHRDNTGKVLDGLIARSKWRVEMFDK